MKGHSVSFRSRPTIASIAGSTLFAAFSILFCRRHEALSNLPVAPFIVLISCFFLFVEPIPQPQSYHNFADKRGFRCTCGNRKAIFLPPNVRGPSVIPNFGDVVSNSIILIGGLAGVVALAPFGRAENDNNWQWTLCLPIFFWATIALALGSTYYHWNPTDAGLVWDRLPMTVAFMAIFAFLSSASGRLPIA